VGFSTLGDTIDITATTFIWKNTSSPIVGAILPTFLFSTVGSCNIVVEGVDLSALGLGKTLFSTADAGGIAVFKNCKLGASVIKAATPTAPARVGPIFINCDSGDTNYKVDKYSYEGTQIVETVSVLTGGASDGTTVVSWRIAATANASLLAPFESLPISIWNETVGSVTVTVQGILDSAGALPTNAQIWMVTEYLGTSGFTQSLFATTGMADILATGTSLSAGSGTWLGPVAAFTKFKMASTITVAEKGPITVKIYVAAASSVFYVDPRIVLT
jgi:hypothetical protein